MDAKAPLDAEARIGALLAAGDERGAATEAMRAFGPKILGYLRSILRDEADAGDAFSVWAEHLWRGIRSFRGDSSFRTWAFKIAYNAALNVRNEAWRRLGRGFEPGEASRLAEEIRTKTAVREERQRTRLEEIRAQLTPEEQTLLTLRIDQQLSWDEIAAVLSANGDPVDPAALRKRFQRLKERLAEMLRDPGE
ncbi:MAG TPA: sigma-70 family RNA polymerase sigma factor [Anaeromyxobacter sp.]|nr:sigma-70 family RNA polymerase sigma factor [Anaeromyxobacter sp.]